MKTLKDLGTEMQLHPRTVTRWSKRLRVKPTVPAHAGVRYSDRDAKRLLTRWQKHWQNKNRKRK